MSYKLTQKSPSYGAESIDMQLMALAQHAGVPTRYLDWSTDPLTAVFFAVGHDLLLENDHCVWTLDVEPTFCVDAPFDRSKIVGGRLKLEWVPTAGNTNIQAPSGVLLGYERPDYHAVQFAGGWRPFETHPLLRQHLKKVTLSGSERPNLSRLIRRERRSLAHMMPSWDNVAITSMNDWKTFTV